jgi:hypothetical protein
MMRRHAGSSLILALLVTGLGAGQSCMNDFDQFDTSGDASVPTGGTGLVGSGGTGGGGSGTGGGPGTGGAEPDAGEAGAGGSGGTVGGSGGTGATGATGGATGGAGGCTVGQKDCGGTCRSASDPAFGCAALDPCPACSLDNAATYKCTTGACDVLTCTSGFDNCTGGGADGCETPTSADIQHCGFCNHACVNTGVASLACSNRLCTPSCVLGKANCAPISPTTSTDNGCERDVANNLTSCGGCNNSCTAQGFPICSNNRCKCDNKSQCGGGTNSCDTGTGLCTCDTSGVCVSGETCDGSKNCVCNPPPLSGPGTPCSAGETCCHTPAGCFNLDTDVANCGACGRACTPGFICDAGQCKCNDAADCQGSGFDGAAGAASELACDLADGLCVCNVKCAVQGQRCLADGSCG